MIACILLFADNTGHCRKKGGKTLSVLQVQTEKPRYIPQKDFTGTTITFPTRFIKTTDTIEITFIGDVMQHGKQLKSALVDTNNPDKPESYNYSHTFRHIEHQLKKADLAVANMEFPLGTPPYSGYPLFSAPESIAWKAKECGIDLFLLANNHLLDKGRKGFLNTLDTYDNMGARYIGAYRNREEEQELNPVLYNIKGIRVAFINFTYGTNGFAIPSPCTINLMDSTLVKETIQKAKDKGADVIICNPHWGEEYQLKPSAVQRKWAKMLQREGIRIIIGSHSHVPQSAEISEKNILFYSLGNYISNQTTPDFTQLELMVTIKIVKNFISGEITLPSPQIEYLWCFKRGEFAEDYTVVPVGSILDKEELVQDKTQYRRMLETYNAFRQMNLIKQNTR